MPNFRVEQARTQSLTALDRIRAVFPDVPDCADAVFLSADRREALGFVGLPFPPRFARVSRQMPSSARGFAPKAEAFFFASKRKRFLSAIHRGNCRCRRAWRNDYTINQRILLKLTIAKAQQTKQLDKSENTCSGENSEEGIIRKIP